MHFKDILENAISTSEIESSPDNLNKQKQNFNLKDLSNPRRSDRNESQRKSLFDRLLKYLRVIPFSFVGLGIQDACSFVLSLTPTSFSSACQIGLEVYIKEIGWIPK